MLPVWEASMMTSKKPLEAVAPAEFTVPIGTYVPCGAAALAVYASDPEGLVSDTEYFT
jgi:hypothetical protein